MGLKKLLINNWSDYWNAFDNLCSALKGSNRGYIAEGLEEAKLHVNGLTDGWFEFIENFEGTINANIEDLTTEELEFSDALIKYIKVSLTRR